MMDPIKFHTTVYPTIAPTQYPPGFFKDKVILITGSGRGIGLALGLAFCSLDARVIFTDILPDAADSAANEAQKTHPTAKVTSFTADIRKYTDLVALHAHTLATFGEIDILIHNAGYGDFLTFDISQPEDTWDTITLNLKGVLDLTRLALPGMIQRKTGIVICVTTTGAVENYPHCIPYMLAKTAQGKFMHCLQMEVERETGIQCFHVHPGCPKTRMGDPEYAMREYVREARPGLKEWVFGYLPSLDEDMGLAVWSIVFLASGKLGRWLCENDRVLMKVQAEPLKGRYINANHDIGELLRRVDYIKEHDMYSLKADVFETVKDVPQEADFYRHNKFLK